MTHNSSTESRGRSDAEGADDGAATAPKTHKLCIVSDGSTGAPKTLARLMEEVARCSDYIESAGLTVSGGEEGNSDC